MRRRRATRLVLGVVLGAVPLAACSGDDGPPAERAAGAAAEACAQAQELLTSPSMDRSYPGRYQKAADAAARAQELDGRWSALATALQDVRGAAQSVVDAARDPSSGNVRQSEVNASYRAAQGVAVQACASV